MPPRFDRKYLVPVDGPVDPRHSQKTPVIPSNSLDEDDLNGKSAEGEKDLGFVDMPVIEMPEDLKVDLMNMFTDIVLSHDIKEEMALNAEGNEIPHGLSVVLNEANVEIRLINGELTIADISKHTSNAPIDTLIARLSKQVDVESVLLKMGFEKERRPVSDKETSFRFSKKYAYSNADRIFLDIEAILGFFEALE